MPNGSHFPLIDVKKPGVSTEAGFMFVAHTSWERGIKLEFINLRFKILKRS